VSTATRLSPLPFRNKDSPSLLLTVGPRVFDLGRIAVAADIRWPCWFAAIRTLRGAA
jgi:hypothetical protein